MLGFALEVIKHPLVLAAGVVIGALVGVGGLHALWARALGKVKG